MRNNNPKIRFLGFNNNWSPISVSELGIWSKGQSFSKTDIEQSGKYPCIHYGELFAYPEIINNISSKTNVVPVVKSKGNEILFPDSDVTPDGLGRCCSIDIKDVLLGSGINILHLKEYLIAPYFALNIVKNKKQIIDRVTGSTVRHINPTALNEISLLYSDNTDEQIKIADLFNQINELIEAKEQELEKLRHIKLALLDKMFPSDEPDNTNCGGGITG